MSYQSRPWLRILHPLALPRPLVDRRTSRPQSSSLNHLPNPSASSSHTPSFRCFPCLRHDPAVAGRGIGDDSASHLRRKTAGPAATVSSVPAAVHPILRRHLQVPLGQVDGRRELQAPRLALGREGHRALAVLGLLRRDESRCAGLLHWATPVLRRCRGSRADHPEILVPLVVGFVVQMSYLPVL